MEWQCVGLFDNDHSVAKRSRSQARIKRRVIAKMSSVYVI